MGYNSAKNISFTVKRIVTLLFVTVLCVFVFSGCNIQIPDNDKKTQSSNGDLPLETLIPKHENDCNNIDQQLASEIKTAYSQYTNNVNYGGESKFSPEDIYILRYEGKIGGCHFVMLGGDEINYTSAHRPVDVAGYVVVFGSGQPLYAYKSGDFYTLKQAYDNEFLSKSDVYEIGTRVDPSFIERNNSSETKPRTNLM